MKEFDYFIKKGDVKKQEINKNLASALTKSSNKILLFVKKLEVNDDNAEHIVQDCYDIIRLLIETKLAREGFKSYSHEATISFLLKFPEFNEQEIEFLDMLRRTRNGIKYYGKESNEDEAKITLDFTFKFIPKLNKILNLT